MTTKTADERQYHHGNLRRALLDEALRVIDEDGASAVSLRELARRIGVSHAAPAHHFADKTALFTAIAVEGLDMLSSEMAAASGGTFRDVGIAYVRFAAEHPAHVRVMYQHSLVETENPELVAAWQRCYDVLLESARRF